MQKAQAGLLGAAGGQPLGGQSVGLRDGRALLSGGFRSFWGLHAHICLAETFCVGGNLVLSIEKV